MGIKEALAQYCDTQQEIKDIKSRIETLERQIAVMEKQGYTQQDSVTGGEGGNSIRTLSTQERQRFLYAVGSS